jgi:DNA replication protein DnaC
MNTMDTTTEEIETSTGTTTCAECRGKFEYERIVFGHLDLGLSLATHCPECTIELERRRWRVKAEQERAERADLVRAVIPPDLLPVALDPLGTDTGHPDFPLRQWVLVAKWRPGPHGNWLGLIGPAAKGKTRCAALLAEKILMSGHRVLWTSAMRLYTEATLNLRSRDKAATQVAREYLAECQNTPFLFLDDLGNNEWSPSFESQLFTILDHRKNFRLPIIYTANVHPEGLHSCITSVNPAALIGRLLDRTALLEFAPDELPLGD